MDQSAFLKRFYVVLGGGSCVLMAVIWIFVKGGLSPRGFAVAALIWWVAMFALLVPVIRSRQRSAEDFRREQIASGVPAETLDREQCLRNIRAMKSLIALFALLLCFAMLATQGKPLLPRIAGASFDVFLLAACINSLMRSRRKLKGLQGDRSTQPSD